MTLNDIGSRQNDVLLVIGFRTDESTANKIPVYLSLRETSFKFRRSYLEIHPPIPLPSRFFCSILKENIWLGCALLGGIKHS